MKSRVFDSGVTEMKTEGRSKTKHGVWLDCHTKNPEAVQFPPLHDLALFLADQLLM